MFFKHLIVYKFTQPFQLPEAFETLVKGHSIGSFAPGQKQLMGFDELSEGLFSINTSDYVFFAIKQGDKLIPASEISLEVKLRKALFTQQFLLKPNREDIAGMKEAAIEKLLHRAFAKYTTVLMCIDKRNQRIYCNASSYATAENALAFLRKMLGSLPIVPLRSASDLSKTMTSWLADPHSLKQFELGSRVGLSSLDGCSSIAIADDADCCNPELDTAIAVGKLVTQVQLSSEQFSNFMLFSDLRITGLKWDSEIRYAHRDQEDADLRCDADAKLVFEEIQHFLRVVSEEIGGYQQLEVVASAEV